MEWAQRRAAAHSAKGSRSFAAGQFDRAVPAYQKSVQAYRALWSEHPGDPRRFDTLLASDLSALGACLFQAGRVEEAVAPFLEAVAIIGRLAILEPNVWGPVLAHPMQLLARVETELGHHDEAMTSSSGAVDLRRAASKAGWADPDLAQALRVAALARVNAGRELAEAMAAIEEAGVIYLHLLPGNPQVYVPQIYATQEVLARVLDARGESENADKVRAWLRTRPLDQFPSPRR